MADCQSKSRLLHYERQIFSEILVAQSCHNGTRRNCRGNQYTYNFNLEHFHIQLIFNELQGNKVCIASLKRTDCTADNSNLDQNQVYSSTSA